MIRRDDGAGTVVPGLAQCVGQLQGGVVQLVHIAAQAADPGPGAGRDEDGHRHHCNGGAVAPAARVALQLGAHRKGRQGQHAQQRHHPAPLAFSEHLPDLKSGEIRLRQRLAENDEGARADVSVDSLGRLKPVFHARGTVTAGNASQMSDGAAAVLLVSGKILRQFNLTPLARFCGYAVAGVPPEIMGIGPVAAIPKALAQAGISLQQLDWIELNEAFAAQALAVMHDLELDPARVNPLGGAIALGHPLGATGAIRTATLVHGLQRTGGRYGMISMCIGTGMGAAGVFERL